MSFECPDFAVNAIAEKGTKVLFFIETCTYLRSCENHI